MRTLLTLLVTATLWCTVAQADKVPCESTNNGYRECRIATSGTIAMVSELSDRLCHEGATWGVRSTGVVWVDRGCRALFVAVRNDNVPPKPKVTLRSVTCESVDGTRVHCPAETTFGVAIGRRLSEAECVLDETWGFDADGVWVTRNCGAQFALGGFRITIEAVPPNALRLTCESDDGKLKRCPVDTTHGVGLLRQRNDKPCILNRTWGYDKLSIWVNEGCRGDFVVAQRRS